MRPYWRFYGMYLTRTSPRNVYVSYRQAYKCKIAKNLFPFLSISGRDVKPCYWASGNDSTEEAFWLYLFFFQCTSLPFCFYLPDPNFLEKGHRIGVILVWHYLCLRLEPRLQCKSTSMLHYQTAANQIMCPFSLSMEPI